MTLTRGRLIGYEFDRMIVQFSMLDGQREIPCAISTSALDDLEGLARSRPNEREAQFERLRDRIEARAARKFLAMEFEGSPSGIILRGIDFQDLRRRSARHRHAADHVGDAHEAMLDHGVAAAVLGGIERGVRRLDQVARPLRVVRARAGDADADGDQPVARGPVRHLQGFHGFAHLIADLAGAVDADIWNSRKQTSSPP